MPARDDSGTTDVLFEGGSAEDRARLLGQHEAYLDANNRLDVETLRGVWDHAPTRVFFNLNGHTYTGFDHWARLWAHYRTQFRTTNPWVPRETRITIGADMAVITCVRTSRLDWIGDEPQASFAARELTSRSTEVYAKRDADWLVVHVHFSPASDEPRPGGI